MSFNFEEMNKKSAVKQSHVREKTLEGKIKRYFQMDRGGGYPDPVYIESGRRLKEANLFMYGNLWLNLNISIYYLH